MPTLTKPANLSRAFDMGLASSIGVQNLFMFDEAGGTLRDLMNPQTLLATPTSGITTGFDTEGSVSKFNGSGSQKITLPIAMQTTTGANLVIIARIKATALQSSNPGHAFGICASTSHQFGFGPSFDNSNPPNAGTGYLFVNGAGEQSYSPSSLNTWVTVASQVNNTGTLYSTWSWVNGNPAATGQGAGLTGSSSSLFDTITFGAQYRSSGYLRYFTGNIEWAAIISVPQTPMPDMWHWQLYANDFPYNLFKHDKPWNFHSAIAATPTFRSYASNGAVAPSSLTVNKPTGTALGDLLIALIQTATGVWSSPTGWTLRASDTAIPASEFFVFTKSATSSEPANYTFTCSPTSGVTDISISCYTGATPPLVEITGSIAEATNVGSTSVTATSITTTKAGLLLGLLGSNVTGTWNTLSGWTTDFDESSSAETSIQHIVSTPGVQ